MMQYRKSEAPDDMFDEEAFEKFLDQACEESKTFVEKKHFPEGLPVYFIDGSEPEEGLATKKLPSGAKEYVQCQS